MKHTKLFIAFVSILVMLGVTSCSSGSDDEPTNPTPTNPTERKLIIEAGANSWLDENGNARETRGAVITTQTLQNFSMHWNQDGDIYANYTVNRGSDGKWIPTPTNGGGNTWPVMDDTSVSFYAHTAGSFNYFNYNGGNRYISFNSEEASGFQNDLLLSKITNVTYSGTGGVIWFMFDHACAAVEFNIQITNKLKSEKLNGGSLTVDSVKLKHIASGGDCYYSAGSGNHIGEWKNLRDYTNYTLTQAAMTVGTDAQPLPCNTMFIIPQTLDADAKLEVGYTLPGQTGKVTEISLENTKWEAGHLYPINIVLGTKLILGTTQTQNP